MRGKALPMLFNFINYIKNVSLFFTTSIKIFVINSDISVKQPIPVVYSILKISGTIFAYQYCKLKDIIIWCHDFY